MLNSTHNLTGLQLGDIDRGEWTKFHGGGGGLRPEVQPLALLYTSFDRKSTLCHSYKIHLLGPSADRNDRFPYLIL